VAAPVSGLVVEKMSPALEGMFVRPGMNLYKLVDLSSIWVDVEVFESQAPHLSVGSRAHIEVPFEPGGQLTGRVRYLQPFFSETTRTMRVSIEVPNPGGRLRAEMYANVSFDVPAARDVVAVPETAVLRTGLRNVVVLDRGDLTSAMRASLSAPGVFAPVEIDGRLLVDGGIVENLPVDVGKAMDVDIVIAVDVGFQPVTRRELTSALAVSNQAITIMMQRETGRQRSLLSADDVLILPDLGTLQSTDFGATVRTIGLGLDATRASAPLCWVVSAETSRAGAARLESKLETSSPPLMACSAVLTVSAS